jgi:hypothetical protein
MVILPLAVVVHVRVALDVAIDRGTRDAFEEERAAYPSVRPSSTFP